DASRPIEFFDEGNRGEKLSIRTIENVEISVSVRFNQQLARLSLVIGVNQNGGFGGIVVEQVMRGELEIPLQRAGVRIESQDAVGIKVVAGTNAAFKIGCRIACPPENRVQFRVVRAWHPGGTAAMKI